MCIVFQFTNVSLKLTMQFLFAHILMLSLILVYWLCIILFSYDRMAANTVHSAFVLFGLMNYVFPLFILLLCMVYSVSVFLLHGCY
jgi:hypothetical protein